MNKITKLTSLLTLFIALGSMTSCNDFLEKEPLDTFTDDTYWGSELTVRNFSWMFYDEFLGYGTGSSITNSEFYFQDAVSTSSINISDDLANSVFLQYQTNPSVNNVDWKNYYKSIRRANLMLTRLPNVPGLRPQAGAHWEGIARFFRAYNYFRLVQRFGDVPYSTKYVNYDDFDNIYLPRVDRSIVMDSVLADINLAIDKIYVNGDPLYPNSVNKYVALAFKSRLCLYEGTYRKYHNLNDAEKYLKAAKEASLELIQSKKYSIQPDFKANYNSLELKSNPEMILYKNYQANILTHSLQSYTNTSSIINGMTKVAVESYACSDGLPISQSPLYKGDTTIISVMANRDKRLSAAVDDGGFSYVGIPQVPISGSRRSSTGYVISLYNNPTQSGSIVTTIAQNHVDAPIFGYAEVLLNYAEACAELNTITQADLDMSINVLRNRAGIAPLTYISKDVVQASGVVINDPKRTSSLEQISGIVPAIIWEIRRDRRAELMTWTFIRYYDLMRWKKGDYLDFKKNPDVALGAHVRTLQGPSDKGSINADGFILPYPSKERIFDASKHYLNSIPTGEITLYESEGVTLTQNPNW